MESKLNGELNQDVVPQVVAGANSVLEARRTAPGSRGHEDAIIKLAKLVADNSSALKVLEELQQS